MADKQDLEPLRNTQQNQLQVVLSQGDSIDNKALAILASNVALIIFVGQGGLGLERWWQYVVLLSPFIVSLSLNGLAIWPRPYQGPMVDLDKHPEYLKLDNQKLILQLLADAKNAVKHNMVLNTRRWRYCVESIVLTAVGTIFLFVILMI